MSGEGGEGAPIIVENKAGERTEKGRPRAHHVKNISGRQRSHEPHRRTHREDIASSIFGGKKSRQVEVPAPEEFVLPHVEDESHNQDAVILKPKLDKADPFYEGTEQVLSSECRRKGVEIDTERTSMLQGYVDRMIALGGEKGEPMKTISGKPVEARVVIMTKGSQLNAFVLPDGTIFVSQALINELDSLDELVGVLAHEVNHIRTETSVLAERAEKDGGRKKNFGVCFAHETAEDILAPGLLEKVGLNSMGLASAIKKISGGDRGTIHQTGLSRASQAAGEHLVLDFETSSQPFTPLDAEMKQSVKETNMEVLVTCLEREDAENIKKLLPVLHQEDVLAGYQMASRRSPKKYDLAARKHVYSLEHAKVLEVFNTYLMTQLQDTGYTQQEINTFFILQGDSARSTNFSMIPTSETVVDAVRTFPEFVKEEKLAQMEQLVFGEVLKRWSDLNAEMLMDALVEHVSFGENNQENFSFLPISEESVVTILQIMDTWTDEAVWYRDKERLNRTSDPEIRQKHIANEKKSVYTRIVGEYIKKVCFDTSKEEGVLEEQKTKDFLIKVKEKNIPLNLDILKIRVTGNDQIDQSFSRVVDTVFPPEELSREDRFAPLDQAIEDALRPGVSKYMRSDLVQIRERMNELSLTDAEKVTYLDYIKEKIKAMDTRIPIDRDFNTQLQLGIADVTDPQELNRKLVEFSALSMAGITLFEKDGPEFYQYMTRIMEESGIPLDQASLTGIYTICYNFLQIDKQSVVIIGETNAYKGSKILKGDKRLVEIEQYNRFLQLPFVQRAFAESEKAFSTLSLKDLNDYYDKEIKTQVGMEQQLFDDDFGAVVFLRPLRDRFTQILQVGVSLQDFGELYRFIDTQFPSGPQKDALARQVNNSYLDSPIQNRTELETKVAYLTANFDSVGPEGMATVAEHITTLTDYLYFREQMGERLIKVLEGSGEITKIAFADVITSLVTREFETLFETTTTDKKKKQELSTGLAKLWHILAFSDEYVDGAGTRIVVDVDSVNNKIVLNERTRTGFRTFKDLVDIMHGLSPLQRFALVHKALVDRDGALTSRSNRKRLGKIAVKALDIDPGFIAEALTVACEDGPAEFLSFPIGKMLGPLIFRGVAVDAVDIAEVGKAKHKDARGSRSYESSLPREMLPMAITQNTQDITVFGPQYLGKESTRVATIARASNAVYQESMQLLEELLGGNKTEASVSSVIATGTEGIISAVEASGPLGKRSLQLARQLHNFSPEVDRRLADSFDSTPTLNKLAFWENLVRDMERDPDGEMTRYIRENVITIDKVIAGGSQNTVIRGIVRGKSGEEKRAVFVYLNPNAEMLIKTAHSMARDVLTKIEEGSKDKQSKKFARMGLVLTDLAQEWSLRDINDLSYEADDDEFRRTMAAFNISHPGTRLTASAPERELTTRKLRIEDEVEGVTVNKLLQRPDVSLKNKRAMVEKISEFFEYQMERPAGQHPDGTPYYLIHSDPHVGNYMADKDGNLSFLGVIDRHMYLKISEPEAQIFTKLLNNGNYRDFIDPFIDNLFVRNKITDTGTQNTMKNALMRTLKVAYRRQLISSAARGKFKGGIDNFGLMRTLLAECDAVKLDVPIELRLMIRNVEMMRGMQEKYEV